VCTAAASDPTNASCKKLTDDKADVSSKQSTLDTATKEEDTAKQVLQAARAAVKASAAGGHVSFSDAPKTNQISDGSVRFVAEATRTIVSTTLLASFAQEECANVWTFLSTLPSKDKESFWDKYRQVREAQPADSAKAEPPTPGASSAKAGTGEAGTPTVQTIEEEFVQLAKNCQANESMMLHQAAMFTPQYGSTPAGPLQVLGGQGGILMTPTDGPLHFFIVGGVTPYKLSDLPPDLKGELEASIPPTPTNGNYELVIERPKGASKAGKVTIFVVDANNAYVQVAVTLEKVSAPTPKADPSAPTSVKGTAGAGNKITVSFAVPKGVQLTSASAKATDKADAAVLSKEGSKTSKSIEIDGCVDKHRYEISVTLIDSTGSHTGVGAAPVTCSSAAPAPAAPAPKPGAKAPGTPSNAKAVPGAGGKITVTFGAPTDTSAAVTTYTATAMEERGGGNAIKDSTPNGTVAPIVLSGCTAGTSYIVTVVANNADTASQPAKTPVVRCAK
jgi:hypothetical protein